MQTENSADESTQSSRPAGAGQSGFCCVRGPDLTARLHRRYSTAWSSQAGTDPSPTHSPRADWTPGTVYRAEPPDSPPMEGHGHPRQQLRLVSPEGPLGAQLCSGSFEDRHSESNNASPLAGLKHTPLMGSTLSCGAQSTCFHTCWPPGASLGPNLTWGRSQASGYG